MTRIQSVAGPSRRTRLTRIASRTILAAGVVTGALAISDDASACGGCFVPPASTTVVSGHRMALSISTTQSVLWDQIQYAGDPSDFAWVLPVKPGARIESSTAAFFEVLEAATKRSVAPAPVNCPSSGGGFGCGQAVPLAAAGDSNGTGGGNPVTVVHQGTVGPYDTVTLETKTPGALNQWLSTHNYNVDPSSQPIIDAYVAEGFDFIALRLQPGQGTSSMTPVRVVQPGASPALPLRMVSIGTGAEVPVVLYVIGEGRWTTQNYPEAKLETSLLSFDFENRTSNYEKLRKEALAQNGGRSWLTSFALQGTLTNTLDISDPSGFGGDFGKTFLDTYLDQALSNGEIQSKCVPVKGVIPNNATGIVENPCPPGEPYSSPNCKQVAVSNVDSRSLGCPGVDDVAVALTGMHPVDTWVTRLEANLPHAALDTDLILQAAAKQDSVYPTVQAAVAIHPDKACNGAMVVLPRLHKPGEPKSGSSLGGLVGMGLAGLGLVLVARRLRPRTARA